VDDPDQDEEAEHFEADHDYAGPLNDDGSPDVEAGKDGPGGLALAVIPAAGPGAAGAAEEDGKAPEHEEGIVLLRHWHRSGLGRCSLLA